jgi:hypothetical protein
MSFIHFIVNYMTQIILPNADHFRMPPGATFGTELEGIIEAEIIREFEHVRDVEDLDAVMDVIPQWGMAKRLFGSNEKFDEKFARWRLRGILSCMLQWHTGESFERLYGENYRCWDVGEDRTIVFTGSQVPAEVISPILSGNQGISQIERVYGYLNSVGFDTNRSCALHVHVSLGWNKHLAHAQWKVNDLDFPMLMQMKNIYAAYIKNREFFSKLIEPEHIDFSYCRPLDVLSSHFLSAIKSLEWFAGDVQDTSHLKSMRSGEEKFFEVNFLKLREYGTVEYRMKEAKGYTNSLGYVRFVVAFTHEAANNPDVTPEEILNKYFLGYLKATIAPEPRSAKPVLPAPMSGVA